MTTMVTREQLVPFLLNAKRNTYAAQGGATSVSPALPGSHQLEYREEDWFYRDVYFGGEFFVGQETVYLASTPTWSMCYSGGLLPGVTNVPDEVYIFLREAMRQVQADRPFRGPSIYQRGVLEYTDASVGDVERFFGTEIVSYEGKLIYQLRYSGGLLR